MANRITALGETVDADGNPVLVTLELKPQNKHGEANEFAVISSAYKKHSKLHLLEKSDILYVEHTKKEPTAGYNCSGSSCLHE